VLNDFEREDSGRYKLPNLQSGSPLEIVVRLRVPANVPRSVATLAEFNLAFIGQESKIAETANATLNVEFDSAESVAALPLNADVSKTVQLLMNARARREAVDKMDRHDYTGALFSVSRAAVETDVMFSRLPTPELAAEVDDLRELGESLKSRQNDVMSRKKMSYRRESLRKGK